MNNQINTDHKNFYYELKQMDGQTIKQQQNKLPWKQHYVSKIKFNNSFNIFGVYYDIKRSIQIFQVGQSLPLLTSINAIDFALSSDEKEVAVLSANKDYVRFYDLPRKGLLKKNVKFLLNTNSIDYLTCSLLMTITNAGYQVRRKLMIFNKNNNLNHKIINDNVNVYSVSHDNSLLGIIEDNGQIVIKSASNPSKNQLSFKSQNYLYPKSPVEIQQSTFMICFFLNKSLIATSYKTNQLMIWTIAQNRPAILKIIDKPNPFNQIFRSNLELAFLSKQEIDFFMMECYYNQEHQLTKDLIGKLFIIKLFSFIDQKMAVKIRC